MTRVAVVFGLAAAACAPAESTYQGVGPGLPTGSRLIAPTGLVAAYDMETRRVDQLLMDFGPNRLHGTVSGTADTDGVFGTAIAFATHEDKIALPEEAPFAIDGPVTVALWLKVHTLGLHQHVIACHDKFALWVTPRDGLRFTDTVGDGFETDSASVEPDRWYSVAAVFSGRAGDTLTTDNLGLYVDGARAPGRIVGRPAGEPPTWKPGVLYDDDACYIGFESHQGNEIHQTLPFEGVIDEVTVYRRALTPAEAAAHARR